MKNSTLLKQAIKAGLKVLHLDIETSPYLVYTYGLWDANISHSQIQETMKITSLAYMSENRKKCYALEWDDEEGCDYNLLQTILPILQETDLIIGQNVDSYDIKVLQWRLNEQGLGTFGPTKTLDTLKLSRKVFRPPSHKLDYRSAVYGFGGKIKQDMSDCIAVALGDKKAQAKRVKYNIKDVVDERKIMWREMDSYQLPKDLVNFLKKFIAGTKPFCPSCRERRQRRFDVVVTKKEIICNNCDGVFVR